MESPPPADYRLLDAPQISAAMFYPRRLAAPPPPGSRNVPVDAGDGVTLVCRWHPLANARAAVLFFHGNGETAPEYDDLAPVYHQFGMSLFVAEYRGYGMSDGHPSFSTMIADAARIADAFHALLDAEPDAGGAVRVLMGRSLGALSAVRLAADDGGRFGGLVLESGAAGVRGWSRFASPTDAPAAWEALRQRQVESLRSITLPLLTIHGAWDELIPLDTALEVQSLIGSSVKELVVIPNAGHNDLLARGPDRYFGAIAAFVAKLT